jgi:hypothetical protein|tara:strand:+ start:65 stop:286 length:222 start_codon:yes stop_codon:yes gene_type:complete
MLKTASDYGFNGDKNYDIDQLNKMYNLEWGDYANMLSCNINQITAYNIYVKLKNCNCCDKHQIKKPSWNIYLQ